MVTKKDQIYSRGSDINEEKMPKNSPILKEKPKKIKTGTVIDKSVEIVETCFNFNDSHAKSDIKKVCVINKDKITSSNCRMQPLKNHNRSLSPGQKVKRGPSTNHSKVQTKPPHAKRSQTQKNPTGLPNHHKGGVGDQKVNYSP